MPNVTDWVHDGAARRVDAAFWVLRIGLGAAAFLAGLDKFFNILTNWSMYMSPLAERILPFGDQTFMRLIGPVEMLVGLAILLGWTRIGAYAAMVWLLAIAGNLVAARFFDLAVRDTIMALASFALAQLAEVRDSIAAVEVPDGHTELRRAGVA